MSELLDAPDEIIMRIAMHLDYTGVMELALISKRHVFLLYDKFFWKQKCHEDFNGEKDSSFIWTELEPRMKYLQLVTHCGSNFGKRGVLVPFWDMYNLYPSFGEVHSGSELFGSYNDGNMLGEMPNKPLFGDLSMKAGFSNRLDLILNMKRLQPQNTYHLFGALRGAARGNHVDLIKKLTVVNHPSISKNKWHSDEINTDKIYYLHGILLGASEGSHQGLIDKFYPNEVKNISDFERMQTNEKIFIKKYSEYIEIKDVYSLYAEAGLGNFQRVKDLIENTPVISYSEFNFGKLVYMIHIADSRGGSNLEPVVRRTTYSDKIVDGVNDMIKYLIGLQINSHLHAFQRNLQFASIYDKFMMASRMGNAKMVSYILNNHVSEILGLGDEEEEEEMNDYPLANFLEKFITNEHDDNSMCQPEHIKMNILEIFFGIIIKEKGFISQGVLDICGISAAYRYDFSVEKVKYMLDLGSNPSLCFGPAAAWNHLNILRYILSRRLLNGVDTISKGDLNSALFSAAHNGNIPMASFLIENGADDFDRILEKLRSDYYGERRESMKQFILRQKAKSITPT